LSSIRCEPSGAHHKYTSDALRSAREMILEADELRRSYARPMNAVQSIVLLTGGPSDDPRTTALEALTVRRQGVYILVVAVGSHISLSEVQSVASQPWNKFSFLVEDSRRLMDQSESLAHSICQRKSLSLYIYSLNCSYVHDMSMSCYWPTKLPPDRPASSVISVFSFSFRFRFS